MSGQDIDMYTTIKNYLSKKYSEELYYILVKFNNSFISNLISMNEKELKRDDKNNDLNNMKEVINKIIEKYIDIFIRQKEDINDVKKVFIYVKENIVNDYQINEFNLRNSNENNVKEEYKRNLIEYCNSTYTELVKNKLISILKEIINNETSIIYDLLINDYYNSFIHNNLIDNLNMMKKMKNYLKAYYFL